MTDPTAISETVTDRARWVALLSRPRLRKRVILALWLAAVAAAGPAVALFDLTCLDQRRGRNGDFRRRLNLRRPRTANLGAAQFIH